MMVLLNDDDTTIAEEVDVPKALGDIFESLAGAIFVDSQFDLSVVWRIYFNIMAEEIGEYEYCAVIYRFCEIDLRSEDRNFGYVHCVAWKVNK